MPKRKQERPAKGTFAVKVRCVVTKLVTCEDCTEEEARKDPWQHASDETELDQIDWEVESVEAAD